MYNRNACSFTVAVCAAGQALMDVHIDRLVQKFMREPGISEKAPLKVLPASGSAICCACLASNNRSIVNAFLR